MTHRLAALAAALLIAGCTRHVRTGPTAPELSWDQAVSAAQFAALAGRYAEADTILVTFARRNPTHPEAREVGYWRALFAFDPANKSGSGAETRRRLDAYLADTGLVLHRYEAGVLRRVTGTLDSLRARTDAALATVDSARTEIQASAAREADAQKETQRLKDELDRTTAELERIRKRLSERRPQ